MCTMHQSLFYFDSHLTPVNNICKEAPRCLLWASNGLHQNYGKCNLFEFPLNLIGKSKMAFLTGQSWCVLKSWYTGWGPEQGFWHWPADRLNQGYTVEP